MHLLFQTTTKSFQSTVPIINLIVGVGINTFCILTRTFRIVSC